MLFRSQLERENNVFKDFYIKCGNKDIAENITAIHYSKIRREGYWEGYIQKQNEAMEICKQCKYMKKAKKLESDKQKLIRKLEWDVINISKKLNGEDYIDNYRKIRLIAFKTKTKEILKILKGENDE